MFVIKSKYLLLLLMHTVYKFQLQSICMVTNIFWKYLEEGDRCMFKFLKKNSFLSLCYFTFP